MHADEERSHRQIAQVIADELQVDATKIEAITRDLFALTEEELRQELARFDSAPEAPADGGADPALTKRVLRALVGLKNRVPIIRGVNRKNLKKAAKAGLRRLRGTGAKLEAAVPPAARNLNQFSLEQLQELFLEEQTAEVLFHLLRVHLDAAGDISAPLALIAEHPDLVAAMTPGQYEAVRRVEGAHRLSTQGYPIPDRSRGAAYTAEPRRIMYCASFTPAYNSNGYATRTRGIVEGLRDQGVDVAVVARSGYPWDNSRAHRRLRRVRTTTEINGIPYIHVPGTGIRSVGMDHYIEEAADTFVREARRLRPSLIQAASNYRCALPALIAARRLGVPFVYEVRGLWEVTEASNKPGFGESERFAAMAELEAMVAKEADSVLVLSEQLGEELVRRGVDADKIELAPNAVDPESFFPHPRDNEIAEEHGIRADAPVIGFAGSMAQYEGLDTLVAASQILVERGVDHQVVIAGSGAVEARLREEIEQSRIDTVSFLGRLPMADIPRLLSTFDVIALPRLSLPVTELVPALKPLEAAGSGKALVLSDVAPHYTVAGSNSERGLLFEAGNAEALADSLQRVIEDSDLRADLARAGRLWALDERNWQQVSRQVAAAHRHAHERHRASLEKTAPRGLDEVRFAAAGNPETLETLRRYSTVDTVRLDEEAPDVEDVDVLLIEGAALVAFADACSDAALVERRAAELVRRGKAAGIPTIYWQNEAPTLWNGERTTALLRFREVASDCDHIVTSDSRKLQGFIRMGARSVMTLQGSADPAVHNPLPGADAFVDRAAYVGDYRSEPTSLAETQNSLLLRSAEEAVGVDIYPATTDTAHFPAEFEDCVRAAVDRQEAIERHKSHLSSLIVNDVIDSPTAFHPSVPGIAAMGAVALSGRGRGLVDTFAQVIPTTRNEALMRGLLRSWSRQWRERVDEAWLQMRAVYRSYLVEMDLAIMLRGAGLPVALPQLPDYGVVLDDADEATVESLLGQSVPPTAVFLDDAGIADRLQERLAGVEVRPLGEIDRTGVEYVGELHAVAGRTHFEDLLIATRFGDWDEIGFRVAGEHDRGLPIAAERTASGARDGLVRAELFGKTDARPGAQRIELQFAGAPAPSERDSQQVDDRPMASSARSIAVVGAVDEGVADALRARGLDVHSVEWTNGAPATITGNPGLDDADIVYCAAGSEPSIRLAPSLSGQQRLIVRVDLEEVIAKTFADDRLERVDGYVFTTELARRIAIATFGVDAERTVVATDSIRSDSQERDNRGRASVLGVVADGDGARLDAALDLLERLLDRDPSYSLRVQGATVEMRQRATVLAAEARWPEKIVFDDIADADGEWYRDIDVVVSPGQGNGIDISVARGVAAGAYPSVLGAPGAEWNYPRSWISATVEDMARSILDARVDLDEARRTVVERYGHRSARDRLAADLIALAHRPSERNR